jgi:hypothetical protein
VGGESARAGESGGGDCLVGETRDEAAADDVEEAMRGEVVPSTREALGEEGEGVF